MSFFLFQVYYQTIILLNNLKDSNMKHRTNTGYRIWLTLTYLRIEHI